MLDTGRKYSCLPNAGRVFILYFYHNSTEVQVLFGADVTVLNQLYKTFCLLRSLHTTLLRFTQEHLLIHWTFSMKWAVKLRRTHDTVALSRSQGLFSHFHKVMPALTVQTCLLHRLTISCSFNDRAHALLGKKNQKSKLSTASLRLFPQTCHVLNDKR